MKKFIVLLVLLTIPLVAQRKSINLSITRVEFYADTLKGGTAESVYYLFPPPAGENSSARTAISETAPTSASMQAINLEYNANGALTLSFVFQDITATGVDSIFITVQSYNYDENNAAWYASSNDIFYLVLDTYGTYVQASIDYLDWTDNVMYTADLGGVIMPGAGIKIVIDQADTGNTGYSIGFWWQR